jgi:hypothetical protein
MMPLPQPRDSGQIESAVSQPQLRESDSVVAVDSRKPARITSQAEGSFEVYSTAPRFCPEVVTALRLFFEVLDEWDRNRQL